MAASTSKGLPSSINSAAFLQTEARQVAIGRHFRQQGLDRLQRCHWLAELNALLGVSGSMFHGRLADANRLRGFGNGSDRKGFCRNGSAAH